MLYNVRNREKGIEIEKRRMEYGVFHPPLP